MLKIVAAETEPQYRQVRELMAEYIAWDSHQTRALGLDSQAFLNFYYGAEQNELPGIFAPPHGYLLLATHSGTPAGCGAFHRIDAQACEMKRLYVRQEFRGMGIGRKLADILISTARNVGYESVRLETTSFMDGARALYASLGFKLRDPYYDIPAAFRDITVFMELDLGSTA